MRAVNTTVAKGEPRPEVVRATYFGISAGRVLGLHLASSTLPATPQNSPEIRFLSLSLQARTPKIPPSLSIDPCLAPFCPEHWQHISNPSSLTRLAAPDRFYHTSCLSQAAIKVQTACGIWRIAYANFKVGKDSRIPPPSMALCRLVHGAAERRDACLWFHSPFGFGLHRDSDWGRTLRRFPEYRGL